MHCSVQIYCTGLKFFATLVRLLRKTRPLAWLLSKHLKETNTKTKTNTNNIKSRKVRNLKKNVTGSGLAFNPPTTTCADWLTCPPFKNVQQFFWTEQQQHQQQQQQQRVWARPRTRKNVQKSRDSIPVQDFDRDSAQNTSTAWEFCNLVNGKAYYNCPPNTLKAWWITVANFQLIGASGDTNYQV